MARRSGVSINTTVYSQFKGVDFSTDASLVDRYRSPWAVNMTADTGGMPEKRVGWETVHRLEGKINGLFYCVVGDVIHIVAHAGTKIYAWAEGAGPALMREGVHDGPSSAANMGGKLWILTGGEFLVYDGTDVAAVSEAAYIPTTVIAAAPSGGGVTYEAVNLVQTKRRNEFIPDGESTVYQLDSVDLAEDAVTATVRGVDKAEGTDFTVDRKLGQVTWKTAPEAPLVGQEGEVVITFATRDAYGNAARVNGCTIMTTYGVGTSDRLIVSGNPAFPNLDWTSGLNDPSYIPDLSYAVVGAESAAIMGYCRLGEYLAIVKEDHGQDSTVFLRSAGMSEEGEAVFSLKQSVAGVGAVSRRGFGAILDEQMFLARTGVYAITTNLLTAERIVQNRSFFVDPKLVQEEGLDGAAAVSWNGMYLLAVNSHVYLLDGRQDKTYRAKSQSEYVYECYYWENVPAVCWMNVKVGDKEDLFFGTADGRVCRFKSELDTMERYSDDGAAIQACWATKADDDGDVTLLKTMIKKGNSVTIKPYARSSAKVCFRTEQDPVEWQAAEDTMDVFDWGDIDFSRFTFNANDAPREILFNQKVKKYKRLQIIIKNDAVNEGFGLFGITKHYVIGNFAKR